MIYAELAGGLGNQMFIYAFARALGLRCGEPVTLLDRQDWRDGAPAHTVCALDALNISPDVKIIADAGFAKAHLPRRNAAKALMIKYEQRRGLMARDWHSFEAAAAPLLNVVGLHFATDGYTPARRGHARDFLAWGYFQSERYFADFAPIIKEELRAKAAPAGPMRRRSPPPRTPSASICAAATTRSPRTRSYRSARRTTTPALSQRSGTNTPTLRCLSFPTTSTGRGGIWTPRVCPPCSCPAARPSPTWPSCSSAAALS